MNSLIKQALINDILSKQASTLLQYLGVDPDPMDYAIGGAAAGAASGASLSMLNGMAKNPRRLAKLRVLKSIKGRNKLLALAGVGALAGGAYGALDGPINAAIHNEFVGGQPSMKSRAIGTGIAGAAIGGMSGDAVRQLLRRGSRAHKLAPLIGAAGLGVAGLGFGALANYLSNKSNDIF